MRLLVLLRRTCVVLLALAGLSAGFAMNAGADPPAADWAKLRMCESSGNYSIVSANGLYRGAYQFDQATWESVGGSGRPDQASAAEQDFRALYLYRMRGWQPWQCAAMQGLIDDQDAGSGVVPTKADATKLAPNYRPKPPSKPKPALTKPHATPKPVSKPAPKPVPKPTARPVTQHPAVVDPVSAPVSKPSAKPVPKPVTKPSAMPSGSSRSSRLPAGVPAMTAATTTEDQCTAGLAQFHQQLNKMGSRWHYDSGTCYTPMTRVGVVALQRKNALPPTGTIDRATWIAAWQGKSF